MKDELSKFWNHLAHLDKPEPLEDACKKAGLEWYSEYGGGCEPLEIWIGKMKKYQTKRFVRKIMRNSSFQEQFILSPDFYHLYLLKTKTKHPAIKSLFGRDSAFSILNWPEMYAKRRRMEPVGYKNPKV